MKRGLLYLVVLLLLAPALLAPSLLTGAAVAPAGRVGLEPFNVTPANGSSNSSQAPPTSSTIPPVVCPLAPVNTTFGQFSCFQMLDLTEIFVILFGITVSLYVYMDADKAELPGEANEVAVTGEEELEMRRRQDEEERLRAELEEHRP